LLVGGNQKRHMEMWRWVLLWSWCLALELGEADHGIGKVVVVELELETWAEER
jgi:hypothetical protein